MEKKTLIKIYIAEKYNYVDETSIIAMFDCANIDDICNFEELFDDENYIYMNNEKCQYKTLESMLIYIKAIIKEQEVFYGKGHKIWRRLKPLYKLLKSFNNKQWTDVIVIKKNYNYDVDIDYY